MYWYRNSANYSRVSANTDAAFFILNRFRMTHENSQSTPKPNSIWVQNPNNPDQRLDVFPLFEMIFKECGGLKGFLQYVGNSSLQACIIASPDADVGHLQEIIYPFQIMYNCVTKMLSAEDEAAWQERQQKRRNDH